MGPLNRPGQRFRQRFAEGQPTGFAHGRQAKVRPCHGTVMLQMAIKGGVHQEDQVHGPGLAQATP